MEAAGLVIGIVGLAGAFKDCIDLFSYFLFYRSLGRDYEILQAKLDIEKTLLLQWAHRVQLCQPNYDTRLEDCSTQKAVSTVLASISRLLGESSTLQGRYGLKSNELEPSSSSQVTETVSKGFMERFMNDFKALQVRMENRQSGLAKTTKLRWIINDKEKFEKLVQDLSHFVSKLNDLVPAADPVWEQTTAKAMLEETLSELKDLKTVGIIRSAAIDAPKLIASPALARFEEVLVPKILQRVWFRTMDDRLEAVAPAHYNTFSWALKGSSDLSRWLKSGSGIFWLSGKAGSGKSTLMKHLRNHKDTRSQLSRWAGDSPLILGSFFFWNLGAPEQKSQIGLSRAVLYQLLANNLSLIPTLLPRMWKDACSYEAHLDGLARLHPPSPEELGTAFQKIPEVQFRQRFCFLIDGLDEYEGNLLDGIAFIQSLCRNSNIKVLLSSRPIPLCVDAFSSLPILRLQDATRPDIESYIQDTLGSHKYLLTLKSSNPAGAEMILQQIADKSAGVFLWVILACRSIICGFAAYDTLSELIKRVDELPPELEGMFRHMLRMVEPFYYEHTAKMLKIAYQRQVVNRSVRHPQRGGVPEIHAFAWDFLDRAKMDFENAPPFEPFSPHQESAICDRVEARLRSRCGGLLELQRTSKLVEGKNTTDYTIEFMHRTVFEFLESPETWSLEHLRISDERFCANAALSFLSMHTWYLKTNPNWLDYMGDALLCARAADRDNPALSLSLLDRMMSIMVEGESSDFVDRDSINLAELIGKYGRHGFIFALGVEANMTRYATQDPSILRSQPLGYPLLYHAIEKPLLYGYLASPSDTKSMVSCLLSHGSDPNEEFIDESGTTTTPWSHWIPKLLKMSRDELFWNLATIKRLLEADASSDQDRLLESHLAAYLELTDDKDTESRRDQGRQALGIVVSAGAFEEFAINEMREECA
ncbi:hypothetical protein FALBO_13424 [Fusarium albosuccineum]|uniref:Small s protein n=1 Tax=Fusarium albosuccineum TaxID=1237068 RepID=A0A8H4L013_9HYPO|nr:hypothetical protein FALBO_13424 [Fusarium albosuccineum]